jgi:hypothetical protein
MSTVERQTRQDVVDLAGCPSTALVGAAAVLGTDRVAAGRTTRRASARADEDAVTLAAEAAALALPPDLEHVSAIVLATTTPPYQEGASVQALAEILGLHGNVFALELSASLRDGLAGARVAAGLARPGQPVLVCAAHAGAGDPTMGDGAVALLFGDGEHVSGDAGEALATVTPAASSAIELRDRWRLAGDAEPRDADRSFVQAIGTDRLARDLLALVPRELDAPAAVIGPDSRASAKLERSIHGSPDPVTAHTGVVGAAHPLLRLLAGLDSAGLVVALSNGLGEAVHVAPTAAGGRLAERVRELTEHGGNQLDHATATAFAADFDPYASGPRAWRDRDVDLRLKGLVGGPDGLPLPPGRRHPIGTVIAWTNDHVYPPTTATEMATVTMDDGGQFYGQVAIGEHVAIGDRVELVPRRLHHGGGMIQYFWKVKPCP